MSVTIVPKASENLPHRLRNHEGQLNEGPEAVAIVLVPNWLVEIFVGKPPSIPPIQLFGLGLEPGTTP